MEESTVRRPMPGDVIVGNNPDLEFVVMVGYYHEGHLHMVSYCRVNPDNVDAYDTDTVHTVTARGWLRMMTDFEGKIKPRN